MRNISWFIFINCLFFESYAQNFPNLQFTHLTQKEGLSNNSVTCIAQDHEGFIWIGTSDGLNRFDGYHVRSFYQVPGEKNSLVNNQVSNVVFDKKDRLWISTREGLSFYDKKTGVFRNFRHDPSDTNSLVNDQELGIYIDHDNNSWVATPTALYYFDSLLNFKKVPIGSEHFVVDQNVFGSRGYLVEDRQNQLWGIRYGYLNLFDRNPRLLKKQFGPLKGDIRCIYEDAQMHYWVGSFSGGLYSFDPTSGIFQNIPLDNGSGVVYSITEWKDQNDFTWIVAGTDAGTVLVNPITRKNKAYYYHPGGLQQNHLSGTNNGCVFVDRQNILWITTDGGVSYVQPTKQNFESWSIFEPNDTSRQSILDYPYAFAGNKEGIFVSTWMRSGLIYFDSNGESRTKMSLHHLNEVGMRASFDSLKPYDVRIKGSNLLWFSADYLLVNLDLGSGKMRIFKPPDGQQGLGLRTIIPYDDHDWWIRTRNNGGNGIYVFDPIAGKFTRHYEYNPDCKSCPPNYIMDIIVTRGKDIYLVSRMEGLFRFDRSSGQFISLLKFEGDKLPLHSNGFECLAEDPKGLIWIGTLKGLIVYDPVSGKIARDYYDDRLIGGIEISALCFDEQGNLWMNTRRGIFSISGSNGLIRNFTNFDGLPNAFADGFLKMGTDHFMYSGLRDYLIRFRPDRLLQKSGSAANVHFSEATVMDRPYFFQRTKSGEKMMVITPGETRFTLDFSILNYDVPGDNRYYYRLDGPMSNWQQNENGHLSFYNISPGNYTLHVKGTNNKDASLAGEEDIVHILVKPQWWQTLWFRVVTAVVILLITIILIRRRISNIRQEARIKQKLAETEMMALRTQMNPHFIFNSLNSIENFIMQNQKRQASDYLNKFARLIRMILENSRDDLVTVTKDMETLQLYIDLEQLRFNHKFSYETEIDKALLDDDFRIPPLLIQPFVENAIVHGLANSDKLDLYLKVKVKLESDFIHYAVEDNGVGRKQAAEYVAQNRPHHKSVGMYITQERINIFNKQQDSKNELRIIDIVDDQGEPAGTRVEIKIKPV